MSMVQLRDQIAEYFNAEELADLCFRLGVQYENLQGTTNAAKARELTEYSRRHGRLEQLVAKCRELRPHVTWVVPQPGPAMGPEPGGGFAQAPTETPAANLPTAMPGGHQPPQAPGMFWMAFPNTWYGPFYGFFIGWMAVGGFQVWHPMFGAIPYPDPFNQFQRNTWVRLPNSPFNVYVDGSANGYVYAQYSPT